MRRDVEHIDHRASFQRADPPNREEPFEQRRFWPSDARGANVLALVEYEADGHEPAGAGAHDRLQATFLAGLRFSYTMCAAEFRGNVGLHPPSRNGRRPHGNVHELFCGAQRRIFLPCSFSSDDAPLSSGASNNLPAAPDKLLYAA